MGKPKNFQGSNYGPASLGYFVQLSCDCDSQWNVRHCNTPSFCDGEFTLDKKETL